MNLPEAAVPPRGEFAADGRRLVIYAIWERRGDVADFVSYALNALRAHVDHLLVVVNGTLSDEGRRALDGVADTLLERENVGYDIWAHKNALDSLGSSIADYDEIVLMNDTWYGPVRDFGALFSRMNARSLDFWGISDHAAQVPNPFTGRDRLPYHLQSYWIAARKSLFLSDAWRSYWRNLPSLDTYFDAVLKHEAIFTEHFTARGFVAEAAFPCINYPTDHPALFNPDLLLADGCPTLKRRPFFHYPPFLDRHAVTGRWILRDVESYGFPVRFIWSDLARNVQPRVLNTDAAMLEVLPDVARGEAPPWRLAVVAHVADLSAAEEVLERVSLIPEGYDLFVTVTSVDDSAAVRSLIDRIIGADVGIREVRIVPSKNGRDVSAFFIECRDVLTSEQYDLVVKVHTMRRSKSSFNARRYFRQHQLVNLLSSTGYIVNLLSLFDREPGLGLVYPPTVHTGYGVLGRGWSMYRQRTEKLCKRLGILVPLDDVSPLAPYGGMFIARREALALLADQRWNYNQFARAGRFGEFNLAREIERTFSYAAAERGFHTRTVLNAQFAAISHTRLEYKVDQLSMNLPGYPQDQIEWLHRAGWTGHGGIVGLLRMYLRMSHPRVGRALDPLYGLAYRIVTTLKASRSRARDLRRATEHGVPDASVQDLGER